MSNALDLNISSEKIIDFLVADCLDLGQLRANKFRTSDRVFKIRDPLKEVSSILQFKAAFKHIKISVSYLDIEEDTLLHCDELRVTQVLLNLLSNALKFTPNNGRIDIKVRYINPNDSLLGVHPDLQPFVERDEILMISVTDNGTGIKEEDMSKLFTLYGFI